MIGLWSLRYSVTRGWNWVRERDCDAGLAGEWLAVFRRDEPDVTFLVSANRPGKSWKGRG